MIKVILRADVDRVGRVKQIISVKDGFARNFLIPQGLAFLATKENIDKVEMENKKVEQKNIVEKEKIRELIEKLQGFSCTIAAEVHDDNLYGSITSLDISKALEEEGFSIEKNCILLESPIKKLGIYEAEIRLHPELMTKIKVWVVKK